MSTDTNKQLNFVSRFDQCLRMRLRRRSQLPDAEGRSTSGFSIKQVSDLSIGRGGNAEVLSPLPSYEELPFRSRSAGKQPVNLLHYSFCLSHRIVNNRAHCWRGSVAVQLAKLPSRKDTC